LRFEIMAAHCWSLRDLYRTLEAPGANRLRAAYGIKEKEDTLAFLLRLNLDLSALESKEGKAITPPGLPGFVPNSNAFVSEDCVQSPAPGFVP
jgi:hypothetical protein